jgi:hypothetical protein
MKTRNPLAHGDARVRLLNSGVLLAIVHIGLWRFGSERATPLALLASYTVMMAVLGGVAFWRQLRARAQRKDFPGAAP